MSHASFGCLGALVHCFALGFIGYYPARLSARKIANAHAPASNEGSR